MARPAVARPRSRCCVGDLPRSAEWVKAVENGRLLAPRLPMLTQIADVLGVQDVVHLIEDSGGVPSVAFAGTRHAALSQVQAALTYYRLTKGGSAAERGAPGFPAA